MYDASDQYKLSTVFVTGMRHAVEMVIYCQKGWGCTQAFIMIITEFGSGSLWIVYCAGQLNTSSLVTGAFSRAHWWQGSAKKYPLNWALLRAGGRGRGVRSVKSRDRDCTILRYPALQNPTGLFDFAQDSLKWMAFFGPVTSQYIAGRPIQPLVVSISLQSFLKLLLSTCSKLEKLFTLCIAAIDPIIETFPQESLEIWKQPSWSAINQI